MLRHQHRKQLVKKYTGREIRIECSQGRPSHFLRLAFQLLEDGCNAGNVAFGNCNRKFSSTECRAAVAVGR
jgi:hypothetical protein